MAQARWVGPEAGVWHGGEGGCVPLRCVNGPSRMTHGFGRGAGGMRPQQAMPWGAWGLRKMLCREAEAPSYVVQTNWWCATAAQHPLGLASPTIP
jgi:hypothetical protein